jgi:hypothetical protein
MADSIPPPIDTSASTSTAPAPTSNGTGTQSNPAAPTASGSVPPSASAPPRPQGGMTDEQKREMVKAFTPEKIASFKKVSRIKLWWSNADDQMLADLMATGQTKENSSRVAQLSNLIDVYDRYKYLNE